MRALIDKLLLRLSQAKFLVETEQRELAKALTEEQAATTAQAIAQAIAQEVQEQAHKKIADVVSRCLETIYDDPYALMVQFERRRGKTEAVFVFNHHDHPVDPTTAASGGQLEVAAFALRLACLVLSHPPHRRVLFLDEPFRNVEIRLMERVRAMLLSLAEELGCQIFLITHIRELVCGQVLEIT